MSAVARLQQWRNLAEATEGRARHSAPNWHAYVRTDVIALASAIREACDEVEHRGRMFDESEADAIKYMRQVDGLKAQTVKDIAELKRNYDEAIGMAVESENRCDAENEALRQQNRNWRDLVEALDWWMRSRDAYEGMPGTFSGVTQWLRAALEAWHAD